MLQEIMITGDRIKAKSENDKTTFFMTKKILDASGTGIDVLKFIPGVQIDIMKNISLEGSRDILIFVDGKERDKSYISQLNPEQIDRVEIISAPPSSYDGNLTGAINIILKKDRDSGIRGQIYAEIPTSFSEVYIFPAYSLSYSYKKLNLYTSYNGEMTYLDIHESTYRKISKSSGSNEFTSNQYFRQKDWSNRFHFGFDYFMSDNDQFNFYAYYNPYSRELDGHGDAQISGGINKQWEDRKEDTDINKSTFYSLYYKHSFNKKGGELTADLSNSRLKAENSTDYIYGESENSMVTQNNTVKPVQNVTSIKLDYKTPVLNNLNLNTGAKARFQVLQDGFNTFDYNENILAAYGNIVFNKEKFDLSIGLRAEKSVADLKDIFRNSVLALLPYTTLKFKLTPKQNLQLSVDRSIRRPRIFDLDPFTAINDPYSISKGNPFLKPEFHERIFLEHSVQFNSNYFASRFFYNRTTDAMNNMTFLNDTSAFETQVNNLGTIHQYGVQLMGTFKLGFVTLNPYVRLSGLSTSGNDLAKAYAIGNKKNIAFESGLSTIVSFKHDLALSFVLQYASPKNNIQGNSFSDALYFISLEKTFKHNIKVGMVSAIPFTRSFTYQGTEIEGFDFYSRSEGNVKMSVIPFWFKFSYQFNSGKNRDKINRSREETDNLPKKGF
jgi:outer membrane receptor protein involved in Fe transport